jgi:lactate racemase
MMNTVGFGYSNRQLSNSEVEAIIATGLSNISLDDKKVLVLIPDFTRTMPIPLFFKILTKYLSGKTSALDFMVALGTHPPLSDDNLYKLVGISREQKQSTFSNINIYNHAFDDFDSLTTLGTILAKDIYQTTEGRLNIDIPVRLNRRILDYDILLICGPVFPHEVVGFSGGNKYFFPGIAGEEIIHITHWLGALITSYEMIGTKDTPVRTIIDQAASMIPVERFALCSVISDQGINGLFIGSPENAFSEAADLSANVHIRWVDSTYRRVLSVLPEMYDEIWTGAKGMYKVEPVISDGGEVIIYAPHIKEFSSVHGKVIQEIGYHVRDYFVDQWDKFSKYPWGILAHSTHLRGKGTYKNGIEKPRIQVTLSSGISESVCNSVNLNYMNPDSINLDEWKDREKDGILFVPKAGEYLYRLKTN